MELIKRMETEGYEQVVFCRGRDIGLRAIIAIHDTTLGPALGGTRMWTYTSEDEALTDALRLAKAMTYKASAAGLALGGGKGVILGDPARDKSEALFRAYGRFVNTLGGRYITAEDVGTTPQDLLHVMKETRHMTGRPIEQGGSGDSAPPTGYGVYRAMQACAKDAFGGDSLKGRIVAIQGFGKVASFLAKHLAEEGARLVVAELHEAPRERARREFGARIVGLDEIYDTLCDVFAPCALGGILNDGTIPRLKCKVVCGAANNQLLELRYGDLLRQRGILYAPDYIVNAGGLINLSFELTGELTGYNAEAAYAKVGRIAETVERVIGIAKKEGISTARAADSLAEERINAARKAGRGMWWGK